MSLEFFPQIDVCVFQLRTEGLESVIPDKRTAVKNPKIITKEANRFGSQCIVLAINARLVDNHHWEVVTYSGSEPTGIDVVDWVRQAERYGAGEILLTSMDAVGTLAGYDLELTKAIVRVVNIPVIASGDAGRLEHFSDVFTISSADAALAAWLFHDNKLSIPELKTYLASQNIPIRL